MRVPPKDINSNNQSSITTIHIDCPIIIPRLPVTSTDKQRVKLTKQIETYCRSSLEYTDLITYLHKYVDMNECTFMNEFKANGKKKGMIEIHHSPFTLFSIVDIVMRKHEAQLGYVDELKVAEEVMRLHYTGLVGLIPLSVTCHQLVHDNQLPVPLWCVYGRFVEFTKRYYDWIPDEILMALDEKVQESRKFKAQPELLKDALKILYVQFVYLDVDGETDMKDGVDPSLLKSLA